MSIHYEDGYIDACPNCGEGTDIDLVGYEDGCGYNCDILEIERRCANCGGTFTEVYQFIHTVFDEETV